MTDIARLEEKEAIEINAGRKAGALMDDPAFAAAFNEVREAAFKTFEASEPHQTDVREQAYHRLKAMKDIKRILSKKHSRGATAMQKRSRRDIKEK